MWCSTVRHCWTLTISTHPHSCEYIDVQPFAMHRFQGGRASSNWFIIILGVSCPPLLHWCSQCYICCSTASHCWTLSSHITYTHVNTQLCILEKYASFCNALFSRMQSIPEKFMIHLTQLGTVSSSHVRWGIGMLNSLHVNHVQSYHLHARQYTNMHPFAMHHFQGCRASLKSLWNI